MEHRPTACRRIVLTTVGSLGDVHPFLAIALGLQARGHRAIVATCVTHRKKVEGLGLEFRPLRPDADSLSDPVVMSRYMGLRRGTERVFTDWLMPAIRESYEDTLAATQGADLLVSHAVTCATRLVAEKQGIPWVSTMVSPAGFFSASAPPIIPGFPELSRILRKLGPGPTEVVGRFLARVTRRWAGHWFRLRREIGLPPAPEVNPLIEGHSPGLHLALFSPVLATIQPGWPPQTLVTGFPFLDRDGEAGLPHELARFLDSGPPPIVFTLGSSAAPIAGRFYEQSAEAARRLGRRAVLITGGPPVALPSLSEGVAAFDYAPFGALFPRAAAVVYPGGVGTTGLVMRAGRPSLVVPHAHDQPDNADRLTRLGAARTIYRRHYTAERASAELGRILDDREFERIASEIGSAVSREDGVSKTCDALEGRFLRV